jgi:hypothetical protein
MHNYFFYIKEYLSSFMSTLTCKKKNNWKMEEKSFYPSYPMPANPWECQSGTGVGQVA